MTEQKPNTRQSPEEKEAFRALFRQYSTYVYTIVWGHLRGVGTPEDAEECMSDVFAEVFEHYYEIREGRHQAYIGTLARRLSIQRYRSLRSRSRAPTPEQDWTQEPIDPQDIAGEYETAEESRALYELVRSLGEPDSTIIVQKYYYDRKTPEIAKSLGMTPGAVRVRLNRALRRLRQAMNENRGDGA